jgi:hypothetical protein
MATSREERTVVLVQRIAALMWQLSAMWDEFPEVADVLNSAEGYPFGGSFDDVAFGANVWAAAVAEAFGGK